MNARKKPLVVLDTNVIVSGFLSGDTYPSKILDAWLFGHFHVVVSPELKQELSQVFKKSYISKILQNQKSIRPILGKLINKSLMISPISISEVVFSDKEDHFL
ncbi:MAG: putative toxin-antitoxin system toxin component, PIN family [Bdellovibrionales bacterium]|nr:putative toxin-antitoxin system toxin component, PIN family [Bdellovibrionales bacterium]